MLLEVACPVNVCGAFSPPRAAVYIYINSVYDSTRTCAWLTLSTPPTSTHTGDTHGQYHDVLRLFEMGQFPPYRSGRAGKQSWS